MAKQAATDTTPDEFFADIDGATSQRVTAAGAAAVSALNAARKHPTAEGAMAALDNAVAAFKASVAGADRISARMARASEVKPAKK